MSKNRYEIWDKKSPVITPVGEVLSAEQWIDRYPMAALDSITVICAAGEINGGFFGTLGQMKAMYEQQGYVFEEGLTDQEVLDAIEEIEWEMNYGGDHTESSPEERIAAALEYQNAMNLPVDESLEDPDTL